jgi:flagellar basal body-associated protein FliL
MIKSFDTSTTPATNSGGSSNTNLVVGIILFAAASYAVYKFWYLPKQERKNEERG